ncbi:threonine/homoserine/homoserine lactone efflux protein [Pseudomonas marginalis]|uniref:LysE family translocator n=1 Tax=Pseudomonas TaxID=286 RepID=UPI0020A1864E|nr:MULTISPECIES: LysE family translocator [Pseudomonas]MCP1506336.1 threonine/homoserine/homoserine lactone efflux protein [Pseudomonas marginalis]MCP1523840.1 threonine/homoserine/homoserine lactone efflux protein [Pseudomonas marginalis]MDQ0502344.1 threonine/homoserine/homoserine lactone efflux protein [Pseudomonas marginalis]
MLSTLLPFMLFAFVASITPGPTNILVLSNSARFGFRATLPIILGACAGAALLVLVVGSGFGRSLVQLPKVQTAMQWIGIAWLNYLAWQIFSAPAQAIEADTRQKPLSLIGAASLQLINPKSWMMALAVVSVFAGNGAERQSQVVYLSLAFFLISLPCLGTWALLGAGTAQMLRSTNTMQRFNRGMALLLLAAAWVSVLV